MGCREVEVRRRVVACVAWFAVCRVCVILSAAKDLKMRDVS